MKTLLLLTRIPACLGANGALVAWPDGRAFDARMAFAANPGARVIEA